MLFIFKVLKISSFSAKELHVISEENFREALFGYKPLGLYGIELHKPGSLGWDDVGGLTEAKRVLKETFVWPMKVYHLVIVFDNFCYLLCL